MKKFLNLVVICLVLGLLFSSNAFAWGNSGDAKAGGDLDIKQQRQLKTLLAEGDREAGLPNIVNFQQKKMMKWIYELADRADLITYTYIKADMTGKLIFVGKTIGYGIPFSAQYTNPEKIIDGEIEGGIKDKYQDAGEINVVSRADPNGLFMPTSSSATWVIMIHPETGEPVVDYWEPELVFKPFPMSKYLGTETVVLPPGFESKDDWGKKKESATD